MVYYLFRFLEQFGLSGAGLWSYISFRALLALIFSLIISAWFGEKFIKYLKSKQITETQRDAKVDPFGVNKIGVPSLLLFLFSFQYCYLAVSVTFILS